MGAVAEFERALIVERTQAGIEAARRRGKRIGRPRVFVPVVKARQLVAAGLSQRQVAEELGVARTTLRKALGGKGLPTEAPDPPFFQGESQPQEAGI